MNAGWGTMTKDFTQISPVKSTQNYKSKCFSKNSSVWWMQGGGFHPWNLVDFTLEIWWISPVKSTQNYKSKCISKNSSVWWIQGGGYDQGFHEIHMKSGRFHVKSARFHGEIHWISWIMSFCVMIKYRSFTLKSGGFHPWNQWISPRFHLWNPPKIIKASVSAKTLSVWWMQGGGLWPRISWNPHEIWQISCEICQISWWNPLDFMNYELLCDDQV